MGDCYRFANGIVTPSTSLSEVSCGAPPAGSEKSSCCFKGDNCLQSRICQYIHAPATAYESMFYVAGCTKSDLNDPICTKMCGQFNRQDIVFNETTSLWHCCGNFTSDGHAQCNTPTNVTFQAPGPGRLLTYNQSVSLAETLSNSSSTTLPSSSSSSTSTSAPKASSAGLNIGAKAAIGVAIVVAVAALALLFALIYVIRSQRRERAKLLENVRGTLVEFEGKGVGPRGLNELGGAWRGRGAGGGVAHEMDGSARNYELAQEKGPLHELDMRQAR